MHQRPFFILTLNVRKSVMCPRGPWKACWRFPNVKRQELKVHQRLFFILTLHVRKTGAGAIERQGTDNQDREVL